MTTNAAIDRQRRIRTTLGEGPDAEVWEGPLAEWVATTGDDEDLVAQVRQMEPGDVLPGGGGAAPVFTIERLGGVPDLVVPLVVIGGLDFAPAFVELRRPLSPEGWPWPAQPRVRAEIDPTTEADCGGCGQRREIRWSDGLCRGCTTA